MSIIAHRPNTPGETPIWPMCRRCWTPVVAYELAGSGTRDGMEYVEVLATCHGKHDMLRISWSSGMHVSEKDLQDQIAELVFF